MTGNSVTNYGIADWMNTGTDGQTAGPQEGMRHLKGLLVKDILESIPSAGQLISQ